jgi:hypothetical protein
MNASLSPVLRVLAPLALILTAGMASANWYFEPEKAAGWAAVLSVTAGMALVGWIVPRAIRKAASGSNAATHRATRTVRGSIVFASLMLMSSLSENFAAGLGLGGAELFDALAERGAMVMTGLFLVFTGNAMPKMLTPLSTHCDGGKAQAFQRFFGWVWVLGGLGFTIAWLVLPLEIANGVGMTCMIAAMVITAAATVRLRRAARPRPRQSGSA